MSQRINRREISGLLAGWVAFLSEAAPAWAQPAGTLSVRQTGGAKRFDSEGALERVAHVAFVNPNGAKTVVSSNTCAACKVQLRLGGLKTEISLPQNSVTNLDWARRA